MHQSTYAMTDKPTYKELEQQLAKAEAKLKKVKKLDKTYVQKNIDVWKKFLAGEAGIKHFMRSSRSTKTTSKHQYLFNRGGKDCFQYKEFVKDLLEAICERDGLTKQRAAMMKHELRKALQSRPQQPGIKKTSKAENAEEVKMYAEAKKGIHQDEASIVKDHVSKMKDNQVATPNMMSMSLDQLLQHGKDLSSTIATSQRRELVKAFHQKGGSNRIQDLQRSLGVRGETISEDLKALGLSD
jgi:hypothetical protein